MKTILVFSAVTCGLALGQGSLIPPGGPAPTMKSLQEIWDKSVALEAQNQTQQQQISALLQKNNEQSAALGILLEKNGVALPWNLSTIVPVGAGGGRSSLAFQPDGRPAISYYDGINQDLKYAAYDGSTWQTATVDSPGNVGVYSALAFTANGHPVIACYDATNGDLKYTAFDGSVWQTATVDSTGDVGTDLCLKISPSGQPSISYFDATNQDLKYAAFDGSQWSVSTVDSAGYVGAGSTLAFAAGKPEIAYTFGSFPGSLFGGVKYAVLTDGGWVTSTIYSVEPGEDVKSPSLAITPAGLRYLAFEEYHSSGRIWMATKSNNVMANWAITQIPSIVLSASDWGFVPSLAISPSGQPVMSITMDPRNWTMAFPHLDFLSFDGSAWIHTTVDDSPAVGYHSSLAFTPSGQPAISYFDKTGGILKFAVRAPFVQP